MDSFRELIRYASLLEENALTESSAPMNELIAALVTYLDGDDFPTEQIEGLIERLEENCSHPDYWDKAGEEARTTRRAKVIPSPPDVEFLKRRLESVTSKQDSVKVDE